MNPFALHREARRVTPKAARLSFTVDDPAVAPRAASRP